MASPKGMNSKHLVKGSKYPPLEPGKLRLYSMRFCPFAERTILTLLAKGADFEVVNINLKSKPDWFVTKNPMERVPTLEKDDQIVFESSVCNEFLDDTGVGPKFFSTDPFQRAQQKMLMERLSVLSSSLYGVVFSPNDDSKINAMNEALNLCEKLLEHDYYSGNTCGAVDYMIFSFVERTAAIEVMTEGKAKIDTIKHFKLNAYVKRMWQRPEVKMYALDAKTHVNFYKSYATGTPDYDVLAK